MIKESERIPIDRLREISLAALRKTFERYRDLGEQGREPLQKNQFGETALKLDIEAEEVIIQALKEVGLPIKIVSEEHEPEVIGENPIYLGIVDGIDGSEALKKGEGRFGTMFGIFEGPDPTYNDYLFCGVMEHTTGRLFYACKGQGAFVIENDKTRPIHCAPTKTLDEQTRIYLDLDYFQETGMAFEELRKYNFTSLPSTASEFADLITGEADAMCLCTYKNNVEHPIGFGLVTEAGGGAVTLDGMSLGERKYLAFGQNDLHIPLMYCATSELMQAIGVKVNG